MKKVLSIVVLLIAVAAAAFMTMKRRGTGGTTPELATGKAAEWAPTETVLFLEIPDVNRTLERWKQNGLYLISQEPEWKEFMAHWDEFAEENELIPEFFETVAEIKKADPGSLFLAVTDVTGFSVDLDSMPKLVVGGFPYRGKKTEVEAVVRKFKDKLLSEWPGAKSELSKHGDIEIETITSATTTTNSLKTDEPPPPPSKFLLAYRDNWLFFGSDRTLLTDTLDRYLRAPGAKKGLAEDPRFVASLKQGWSDPDITLWVDWKSASEFISGTMMFGPSDPTKPKKPQDIQSLLFTMKLDGPLMRDRWYFHLATPPTAPVLANRALAQTTPDTYVYGVADFGRVAAVVNWMMRLEWPDDDEEAEKEMKEFFAKKGLTLEEIFTTFGPEMAFNSDWPKTTLQLPPSFLATVEIRDHAKARKFADLLAESTADEGAAAVITTEGDTTRWVWDAEMGPLFKPTLVMTKTQAIFGLNEATVDAAVKQLANKGPNVATKPASDYPAAIKTIPAQNCALLYLDTKTLLARGHPWMKTTLVQMAESAKQFDPAKLPKDETFLKHLQPLAIGLRTTDHGWLLEGAGTVNFVGPQSNLLFLPLGILFGGLEGPPPPPSTPEGLTQIAFTDAAALLSEYEEESGALPTQQQGLDALVNKPTLDPKPEKWRQITDELPKDGWGNPLQYVRPGKHDTEGYDLISNGPDGKAGTADDVGGWALTESMETIGVLAENLEKYKEETGSYPTAEQGLSALVTQPALDPKPVKWKQIMPELKKDGWGNAFHYRIPGKYLSDGFEVFSAGPDGKPDTQDDMGNW